MEINKPEALRLDPMADFDRDLSIHELLPVRESEQLTGLAEAALGTPLRLMDLEDNKLAGSLSDDVIDPVRIPISLDFEPLAYLESASHHERLKPITRLLEWNLSKQLQYRFASTLHIEVVQSDYEELQRHNQALAASEARYKELSEQLEQRVLEQIETIKTAERQLFEQEKLASVGQLAAGIAHEINNPIGFISSNLRMADKYVNQLQGYIEWLQDGTDTEDERQKKDIAFLFEDFNDLLSESSDGCERVTSIVKNLKDFSDVDATTETENDINELIRTVHQLYASKIPEDISVALKLNPLPMLKLNSGHMSQVFLNLLTNAVEAFKGSNRERDRRIGFSTEFSQDVIIIKVSDNGSGMPEETLKNIFVPFFTTRAVGQGTGLGLTICRDIVTSHGGHIDAKSKPGYGTIFTISLPTKRDL